MRTLKFNQINQVLSICLVALVALFTFACSDDDVKDPKDIEGTSKYVLTDSVKTWSWSDEPQPLYTYRISKSDFANGNYNLLFEGWAQGFVAKITLGTIFNGQIIDLTKKQGADEMPWSVDITFIGAELIKITGNADNLSTKVKSGSTLYIKTLNKEKSIYEVRLNIIMKNDDVIKIDYKGTLADFLR